MCEENTSQKERFLQEVEQKLLRKELDARLLEDGLIRVKWNGQPLCSVDRDGIVRFRPADITGPEVDRQLRTVIQTAGHVKEYGCSGGVLFIPPQLVPEVVDGAAKTQVKDMFGFDMITANKFTTAQIDKNTWSEEMLDLLMEFIKTDPRAEKYRNLDWSHEYDLARNGDPTDTQSAL